MLKRMARYVNLVMIPSKLVYFFHLAMVGAYAYYSNIFLHSPPIELTLPETGLISGMTHVAMVIFGPLWGMLVDHTGKRKLIFSLLFIGYVSCTTSMPFVAGLLTQQVTSNSTNSTTNSTVFIPHQTPFRSPMFFAMFSLGICATILTSPLGSMIDAAVMNVVENRAPRATYGAQRLFGGVSFGVGAMISGSCVDLTSKYFESKNLSKYTIIFCVYLAFATISLPLCLWLLSQMKTRPKDRQNDESELQHQQEPEQNGHKAVQQPQQQSEQQEPNADSENAPKVNRTKMLLKTFSSFRNIIFLLSVFVQGLANMVLVAYLFILMKKKMPKSIGGTTMGLTTLIQSVVQVLIFPFADKLIKIVGGTATAMEISVFSYSIRFLVNSLATHPGYILATQLLHCLGFSLFWAAAVVFTRDIAPQEIYITTFAVVNSAYFGLGGLAANVIGGVVYSRYGGDILFQGVSVLCTVWTLVMIMTFQGTSFLSSLVCSRKAREVHPQDHQDNNNRWSN